MCYDLLTLTIEYEGMKVTISEEMRHRAHDLLGVFRRAALAMNHSPESWDDAITDAARLIRSIEKMNRREPEPNRCQFCWNVCDFPEAYCSDDCKQKHEWQRNGHTETFVFTKEHNVSL
jgi:hypothetical protein